VLFVPITPLMALKLRYNRSLDTMNFIFFFYFISNCKDTKIWIWMD